MAAGREREAGRGAGCSGKAYHEHIQQSKMFLADGWSGFFYKGTMTLSYVWACYRG